MDAVLVSLLLDLKTCLLIGTPILVNKFPLLYQLSPTGQCPIKPNTVKRVCQTLLTHQKYLTPSTVTTPP